MAEKKPKVKDVKRRRKGRLTVNRSTLASMKHSFDSLSLLLMNFDNETLFYVSPPLALRLSFYLFIF